MDFSRGSLLANVFAELRKKCANEGGVTPRKEIVNGSVG
jgi:hypothetical protein